MNSIVSRSEFSSWRAVCAGLLLALISACGGSGGGLDPVAGESPPVADGSATGSLGITVGDDPARDFDEILITVNSVALIGGEDSDGPLLLSEEPFTFDLLALEAATELLVAVDDVPVGSYSKIRLQLDSIVLNRLDEDGAVEHTENARLVANGKLDLNPRGPFEIAEGRVVLVQLDIRAGPAFLITPGGPVIFRPVVFVDIIGDADLRRITFLSGRIQLLTDPEDENAFELCDARPLTGRGAGDRRLDECRRIDLATAEDEETVFFDRDGNPIEFGAVDDQSPAIVAGRLLEINGRLGFEALMVQLGERSDFKRIRGVLADDLADDRFRLRHRSDPEDEGRLVQVQPGALLFDQRGELLDVSVLTEGTRVRAMGVRLAGSDVEEPRLLATAIAVEVDPADEAEQVTRRGEIMDIEDNRIDLMLEEGGTGCAVFSDETTFTEVMTTDDGQSVTNVSAEALAVELLIEALGIEGDNDCVLATEIVIEIEGESQEA